MGDNDDHVSIEPFLFASRDATGRRRLAQLKAARRVRAIGPRLYTSLPPGEVEAATRRSWSAIIAGLFPGALISHRTALDYAPDPEGTVFLTSGTNRRVTYPGLTLEFVRGPGPRPDDPAFIGLRASSRARAILENLSRNARRSHPRTVTAEKLEALLEQILRDGGEAELGALRDQARVIATELGWRPEYARLDALIGALLGTRSARLHSPAARARAMGEPFDPACFERLQLLFGELRTRSLPSTRETRTSAQHVEHKAFFEAYFSNFIEGTTFEIGEAEAIVFDKQIPAARPIDAHDILGTFALVSDLDEMRRAPATYDAFVALLQERHATLLARRPDVQPGTFKRTRNRAGDTIFVLPEYVRGTLRKGHALYLDLDPGLRRAIFMAFLVADVHPFNDGNGRVARVMMNAELVAAGAPTIIIPTVYRDDYLLGLRALTRRHRPGLLVDMFVKAAAFSNVDCAAYPAALAMLQRCNWFREPDEARIVTSEP